MNKLSRQELLDTLMAMKDIDVLCPKCQGWGSKTYSSTATWRGGIGGQVMTTDVCDKCWGSGDATKPWTDLRKLRYSRNTSPNPEPAPGDDSMEKSL
ncbi:Uncharacterised protein [uncultured archaeon]|nr:Uncharacterised protein [uncultured archaeon]